MAAKMTVRDAYWPLEEVATENGRGLREVTGRARHTQRILRALFTVPGELVHRADAGAGLQEFQNRPATSQNVQEVHNRVRETLETLDFVEAFRVEVDASDAYAILINIVVVVEGAEFEIPEVNLGNP